MRLFNNNRFKNIFLPLDKITTLLKFTHNNTLTKDTLQDYLPLFQDSIMFFFSVSGKTT